MTFGRPLQDLPIDSGKLGFTHQTLQKAVAGKTREIQRLDLGDAGICFEGRKILVEGSYKKVRQGVLWDHKSDTFRVVCVLTSDGKDYNHAVLELLKKAGNLFLKTYGIVGNKLVQEWYDCDLFMAGRIRAPLPAVQSMCRQIMLQVEYLHRHNIAHRDIKDENILLRKCDWSVKLTDYDGAGDASCYEHRGTPIYLPPELWRYLGGLLEEQELDEKARDIWAAGMVAASLIAPTVLLPWETKSVQPIIEEIAASYELNRPLSRTALQTVINLQSSPLSLTEQGIEGIARKMLNIDPKKRPTAKQVLQELQHVC